MSIADDLNTAPQEDGSYESAVAAMPDLLADDPKDFDQATGRPITPREPDGKFKGKDAEPEKAVEEVKEPETKDTVADDDEEDYIELAAEKDGEAPVRVKVNEAIEGWQKAKTLEAELEKARAEVATPLPHEIEQHVIALQKERNGVVAAMKQWQAVNRPVEPNLELTNPNSPNYNPELFHSQLQMYQRQLAQHGEVSKRIADAEKQSKDEQEAIRGSKIARETAEVRKIWPEVLTDPNARVAAKKALFDHYKIDDAFLDSDITLDHRIYALAKDALAFRALQGKQVEAVKAVKAKPRLVQSQARSTPSNPRAAKSSAAFEALTKSGSVEDAADALEGLL